MTFTLTMASPFLESLLPPKTQGISGRKGEFILVYPQKGDCLLTISLDLSKMLV